MARIAAVLSALYTAFRRDTKSLGSFASNNFFLMSALFLQQAGVFVYLIVGLVLLFPLSTDPLQKIPPNRLALWPLTRQERSALHVLSPWLNPVTWILAALAGYMASRRMTLGLWSLIAGFVAIAFVVHSLPPGSRPGTWRHVPHFPGRLNHLIRKNLREMLSTLDFYCGFILSLTCVVARAAGVKIPPDAIVPLTLLVILALSSYAQCLFGLDSDAALTRYRLLPARGWQLLAAKDVVFLMACFALSLPLAPLAGTAAGLAVLAVGHAPSVNQRREQTRWRFSSGASFVSGLLQVVLMAGAATTVSTQPLVMLLVVAGYFVSTWWYGRIWDRQIKAS